jgi:hypothetical protein
VTSVNSGAISGFSLTYPVSLGGNAGTVTPPSNPVSAVDYNSTGSGASFNLTWGVSETYTMAQQVTATHGLIDAMVPILNSPSAVGFVSVSTPDGSPGYNYSGAILPYPSAGEGQGWAQPLWWGTGSGGGIEVMTKWYQGGAYANNAIPISGGSANPANFQNGFYVIADTRYGEHSGSFPVTATFTIPSGYSTATVVGENRSISISGATFQDQFASASAVHIYMIQ